MEWEIFEHHDIEKTVKKLPISMVKKYEYWKNVVSLYGPAILQKRPGLHDEKLAGRRQGQRSSRLSLQYRVIYEVHEKEVAVYIIEITPHKY
jgi:mRNA-degrading endonuclease RelE of RelBE toxin-antitoxin system